MALKSVQIDRSGNKGLPCDFCDKDGHTEDRCFVNPNKPNNKLPTKLRALVCSGNGKSGSGSSTKGDEKDEIVRAILEKTTIVPPHDLRYYADSGATVRCFHSDTVFVPGSRQESSERTVMLADKTCVK